MHLTFLEVSDLKDLKSNLNVVTREDDKGSFIVIMYRQHHIDEGSTANLMKYLYVCALIPVLSII